MSIKILMIIGTGSFIGGVCRYLCSLPMYGKDAHQHFPWWTLAVNVLGCLLIGMVFGYADRWHLSREWKLFFTTGFLGGFTTFSSFSHETVALLNNGQYSYAASYVVSSVVLGLLATILGLAFIRLF